MSFISSRAALQAPFIEFGVIPPPGRIWSVSVFAIPYLHTIYYFAGQSKRGRPRCRHLATPLLHGTSAENVTSCHRYSRGRICCQGASAIVRLIYYCAFCNLDRFSTGPSHHANTVPKVLTRQKQFYVFDSSHHTSEVKLFTGEIDVWIHASTCTPPGSSIPIRPLLCSQLPSSSPMQIEPPTDWTAALHPMSYPYIQTDQYEAIKPSWTTRESVRPLQKETICPFIEPVTLTLFLQLRILLCDLLFSFRSLRCVLGSIGAANCGKTSILGIMPLCVLELALVVVHKKK